LTDKQAIVILLFIKRKFLSFINMRSEAKIVKLCKILPIKRLLNTQLMLLLIGLTAACAGGFSLSYTGTPARPENRFDLQSLSTQETKWQSKDITIYYTPVLGDNMLNISGWVERGNTIRHYPVINLLYVYAHFLTPEGTIIDTKLLWAAGTRVNEIVVKWTFQKQWPLPADATGIGFSYRGGVSESGSENGNTQIGWEVWQRP
jgi:hypothetical protein